MGTIIYENRNKIVELENAEERMNEHIGVLSAFALLIISIIALIIRSSFFDTISVAGKLSLTGSMLLTVLALIWTLRTEKKETDVKMLLSVGLVLVIPALF